MRPASLFVAVLLALALSAQRGEVAAVSCNSYGAEGDCRSNCAYRGGVKSFKCNETPDTLSNSQTGYQCECMGNDLGKGIGIGVAAGVGGAAVVGAVLAAILAAKKRGNKPGKEATHA